MVQNPQVQIPRQMEQMSLSIPNFEQYPTTYPYNTLNPQILANLPFSQAQGQQIASQQQQLPFYAPIPFPPIQPAPSPRLPIQPTPSPAAQIRAVPRQQVSVEVISKPLNREGMYIDDPRQQKRPKRTSSADNSDDSCAAST
jgi:hypothetical protein